MAKDPVSVNAEGTATAVVTFPVTSAEDAAAKVQGWKLHEGCTILLSVAQSAPPIETDESGEPGLRPDPLEPTTLEGEDTDGV